MRWFGRIKRSNILILQRKKGKNWLYPGHGLAIFALVLQILSQVFCPTPVQARAENLDLQKLTGYDFIICKNDNSILSTSSDQNPDRENGQHSVCFLCQNGSYLALGFKLDSDFVRYPIISENIILWSYLSGFTSFEAALLPPPRAPPSLV